MFQWGERIRENGGHQTGPEIPHCHTPREKCSTAGTFDLQRKKKREAGGGATTRL